MSDGPAAVIVDSTGANIAEVKAASTAAVATDKALVVAVSPNNVPVLPSGASTSALQTTGNTSIASIDTKTPALGQAVMAASTPVVIASNQTAIPVNDNSGSLTVDATSWPLPTGAATETTLSAISGKLPAALGQTTMAGSLAVVFASNQSAIPITDNAGSLTVDTTQLPAALVGGRLDTNIGAWLGSTAPTVGQKTSANSIPVVLASDQSGGTMGVQGIVSDGAAIGTTKPVIVGGFDGTNAQTLLTDSQGRLVTAPPGAGTTYKGLAFGNVTLAATTPAVIRNASYVEQTSNAQRSIVSDNANDTAAGSGARTVQIDYYTATFTGPFSEVVTMNGTTPVNTVATDICYIERMFTLTAGAAGGIANTNAGIVSLKAATGGGGATIVSIAAGELSTRMAHHYVATGRTCYVSDFSAGIKGADTTGAALYKRALGSVNNARIQLTDNFRVPSSASASRPFGTPFPVVGPAVIEAYALPDSTSSRVYHAAFSWYEE